VSVLQLADAGVSTLLNSDSMWACT